MLVLDQERAVAALPQLLASASAEQIRDGAGGAAPGRGRRRALGAEFEARLAEIARLFEEAAKAAQAGRSATAADGEMPARPATARVRAA